MSKGGGIGSFLPEIAAAVATPFIGPEALGVLGIPATTGSLIAADALTGAGLGALGSAIGGGDPLRGALTGGIGGGFSGALPSITGTGASVPGASGLSTPAAASAGGAAATGAGAAAPAVGAGALPDFTVTFPEGGAGALDSSLFGGTAASAPDVSAAIAAGAAPSAIGEAAPLSIGQAAQAVSEAAPLATAAGTAAPSTSFLSKLASNPTALLGAVSIGLQAIQAASQPKTADIEKALLAQAQQQTANQAALSQPLLTGKLPSGLQAAVDQSTQAAKARLISSYAARGQDTNPATNVSLAQDLNAIDQNALASGYQLATQLYQQGIGEAGITSQLYNTLLQGTTAEDKALGSSLAAFSGALAGAPAKAP